MMALLWRTLFLVCRLGVFLALLSALGKPNFVNATTAEKSVEVATEPWPLPTISTAAVPQVSAQTDTPTAVTASSTSAPTAIIPFSSSSPTMIPTPSPTTQAPPAPSPRPTVLPIVMVVLFIIFLVAIIALLLRNVNCISVTTFMRIHETRAFATRYTIKNLIKKNDHEDLSGTFFEVFLAERNATKDEVVIKFSQYRSELERKAALTEHEIIKSCQANLNIVRLIEKIERRCTDKEFQAAQLNLRVSQSHLPRASYGTEGSIYTTSLLMPAAHTSYPHHDATTISKINVPRFVALVLTHYPNGSLQEYIDSRTQPIPEALIWLSMFQIASAVQFLHTRSPPVLHQDIKPENVLIDLKLNRLVVTGFGRAMKMTPNINGKRDGTHQIDPATNTGTPSKTTDIWALGCVLYVLCKKWSAAVDWGERDLFSRARNIETQLEIVREIKELGYSSELAGMCVKMLNLKVDERLSAEEVIMWCERQRVWPEAEKAKFESCITENSYSHMSSQSTQFTSPV